MKRVNISSSQSNKTPVYIKPEPGSLAPTARPSTGLQQEKQPNINVRNAKPGSAMLAPPARQQPATGAARLATQPQLGLHPVMRTLSEQVESVMAEGFVAWQQKQSALTG